MQDKLLFRGLEVEKKNCIVSASFMCYLFLSMSYTQ